MKFYLPLLFAAALAATPAVAKTPLPEARLTIQGPAATYSRYRVRHGVLTRQYVNRNGLVTTTQWPLILRIESRTAVGFVGKKVKKDEREALVLSDPDECFNLLSLVDDMGLTAFDPACEGFGEDETYVEVQTEKHDTFEVFDNDTTGNSAIRARLIDDKASDPAPRNTPYLKMFDGKVKPVGPKTGGRPDTEESKPDQLDGYGYGADDDLASLVLMADIGGARVFDENFDLTPGIIRNMAGFVNTISAVDVNGRRQSTITAYLHALAGAFEPIAVVDANVSDPSLAGYEYAIRVDSGPLTGINLDAPFPSGGSPEGVNAFYDELLSNVYPTKVTIRAVIVNGEAPDYVEDLNGDGKYSAIDVRMAGYHLLTNEVSINLELVHANLLTESPDLKCPPRTLLHNDLDGDADRGMLPECKVQTSGSSRARRKPR